ncbi:myb-like protein X [Homarus americanus]|uniref:myb-like protein X n=1 Tax=Homarus americanus TaxID=6706 RepID=UPI001C461333|nr:myb-like protein X [Homarus americanus]XP_042241140.1 myb-like protein X [Homarus americanus]XP_042241141.1 myb-like protein X [Homarus americanus]XP_042241142.1 myb-like protein X [Homarus americanus]XP_042241143.1 myb-like protein X [Homarus americanus]XP_042241144.1 myb-like protein X [Homarus americanus]
MERNIPHVLDVFTCSPRARRRVHTTDLDQVAVQMKDAELTQKNPGNDSAVSVGSSDDDDEANISKYFDYLNDDDPGSGSASRRKKKKKSQGKENQQGSDNQGKENQDKDNKAKEKQENEKSSSERTSRKENYEKDMRHIERHLSMKKTIRKKMMRDLQQAFVEDPGEFQQDPNIMAPEKKNNIDIRNLTFSKSRLSKSEHNFLDMLKDETAKEKEKKERKGILGYRDFMKNNKNKESQDVLKDDDSGNGSPSREAPKNAVSKEDLIDTKDTPKEEKKIGFWKKLTGKGKSKR